MLGSTKLTEVPLWTPVPSRFALSSPFEEHQAGVFDSLHAAKQQMEDALEQVRGLLR